MSPTYDVADRFGDDYEKLSVEQRARFGKAYKQLVEDLRARHSPRPGLRVKRVQGTDRIFELTWAPDGRATWEYGEEQVEGEPHVVWRRIGTHDIFRNP